MAPQSELSKSQYIEVINILDNNFKGVIKQIDAIADKIENKIIPRITDIEEDIVSLEKKLIPLQFKNGVISALSGIATSVLAIIGFKIHSSGMFN
jgi:hypothetical protein